MKTDKHANTLKPGLNISDCVFCAIIEKKIPAVIIDENDSVIVIKDRAPKAPIHYLIIPKKHIQDIQSLLPEDSKIPLDIFVESQELAKKIPGAADFKLLINSGYEAGQRVFHLHAHFIAGKLMGEV